MKVLYCYKHTAIIYLFSFVAQEIATLTLSLRVGVALLIVGVSLGDSLYKACSLSVGRCVCVCVSLCARVCALIVDTDRQEMQCYYLQESPALFTVMLITLNDT